MADIVVSYSSEDRERVRVLATALEKHGWSVWWDRKIPFGKSWPEVIEEQVDAARCIIVLWSVSSVLSDWVRTEAREGKARGILIPVLIDDVKIPLEFRHMQAANLTAWPVEAVEELEMLVTHVAEILRAPDAAAATGARNLPVPGLSMVRVGTLGAAQPAGDGTPTAARGQRRPEAGQRGSTPVSEATLLHTLGGPAPVCCLRFLPEGETLVALWQDHTAETWRVADGRPLATRRGEGHAAWRVNQAASFSPDGTLLATTPDIFTVLVWRVIDGKLLHTLTGHTDVVNAIAFSADGSVLASGSDDKTTRLWNTESGTLVATLKGHTQWVRSVALSDDGLLVATGGQVVISVPELKVWRIPDNELTRNLWGHNDTIHALAFSPDGTMLASGSEDHSVRTWQVAEWTAHHTLRHHSGPVSSVAFSPDGALLVSASGDKTIALWSMADGSHLQTLHGHGAPVNCLAFSPDGTVLASGSQDHTVRLWTLA